MCSFSTVKSICIAILDEFSVEDFYSNIRSSPFSSFHIIKSRDVIVVKLVTISTFVSDFHCVLLIFLRLSTVKILFFVSTFLNFGTLNNNMYKATLRHTLLHKKPHEIMLILSYISAFHGCLSLIHFLVSIFKKNF